MTVGQVMQLLEDLAPPELAESWDQVGLQVGDPSQPVSRVLVALGITSGVVEEAVALGCEMIVAHHPLIFRPLASLRADRPAEALVLKVVAARLAVGVAHTNLDRARGGMNDWLAEELGLLDPRPVEGYGLVGLARIGHLPRPMTLAEWVREVARRLGVPALRYVGDPQRRVSTVMSMSGSGGSAIQAALREGADVLVTGDMKFHQALDAQESGLAVVDAGHFASEALVRTRLTAYLQEAARQKEWPVEFLASRSETDPFSFYRLEE